MPDRESVYERIGVFSAAPQSEVGPDLYELFLRLTTLTSDLFHEKLHELGYPEITLGLSQAVFRWVGSEGSRPQEIAQRAGLTGPAVSQRLAQIIEMGYLETVPVPGDARGKLVVWTDRGRELLETVGKVSIDLDSLAAERLGDDGLEILRTKLIDLVEHLMSYRDK